MSTLNRILGPALVAAVGIGMGTPPAMVAGSAPSALQPAARANTCALASNADLGAILGKKIVNSKSFSSGGDACMWYDEEKMDAVQVIILTSVQDFEAGRTMAFPGGKPIAGLGVDAFLMKYGALHAKTTTKALFVQSSFPVADGKISDPIKNAAPGAKPGELAIFEASYRIAKLVLGKV